jgi:uncharacterized protein YecA (UPF0149 family)
MGLMTTLKKLIEGPANRELPQLGRNERCWCGSGLKYKRCHMAADDRKRMAARSNGPRGVSGRPF